METRKFTFGEGPLGLGLADAPNGKGVVVTEVLPGSAAAELGVEPNVTILALNGSDVTGHVMVSLGKMIGYLPRPLTVTMTIPAAPAEEQAAPAAAEENVPTASAPAAASAEGGEAAKMPKLKKTARRRRREVNHQGQSP